MESNIRTLIADALQAKFGVSDVVFSLERPKDLSHGDYATNVALIASKQLGKNPTEIATELMQVLQSADSRIASVSVAAPGFINFELDRSVILDILADVNKDSWGQTTVYEGKKILVEHSSPNLFKPFHIGHLMNNTVGESITRLAKASGADVSTMSFPSDVSLGVAKAVFILLEKYGADFAPEQVSILGDAYVEGTKRYEDDESVQTRVKEIADNLYAQTPSPEWSLYERCKEFNIAYFETIVARLGSHFDSYIYESEAGVDGKKLVLAHTPKVFTESEGAIVYTPDESQKLHTAVFINSKGNPTYEAKDLGLLELKFAKHNPDLSIFITDAQQVSHFNVVLDAAMHINPLWKQHSLHRYHGRMSFKGQKMSSRLGGVPLAEDVLATVVEEVKEKNADITPESAEMIGIAAIRLVILRAMPGKDINFDPETSLSFEGDSGPYLQYTAVRAMSLVKKGEEAGIAPSMQKPIVGTEILERMIARFPDIVIRCQTEWTPHYLVTYLMELAQAFNSYYGQQKIIDDNTEASAYRLGITHALYRTMTKGLALLGSTVPEKM